MLSRTADPDLAADAARYGARPALREQSWWAVRVYRFGRQVDTLPHGARRRLLTLVYWLRYRVVETLTGISLPKAARVGPGLRIHHFGGIVVHPDTVVGSRCTLRHGITLGERATGQGAPQLGDDVELGAYAQVLGRVRVGSGAKIGALAVVLDDVPPGAIVLAQKGTIRPR